jgi:hypothetical protein
MRSRETVLAPNTSTSLQTSSVAEANLAEGQFLLEEHTSNKQSLWHTGHELEDKQFPKVQNLKGNDHDDNNRPIIVKVKLFLWLINYDMKMCGNVEVQLHVSLTSTLVGRERAISRSGRFTPQGGGQ